MRILHFKGKGCGSMKGIEEYVVFADEIQDVEEHTAPGFKLKNEADVLIELPDFFPLDMVLAIV